MTATWPLRIYYDASCPLCREEMHALKDHDSAGCLALVDASAPGFTDPDLAAAGIPRADLMRLIHARDAAGRWFIGVEVFELAYAAAGLHGMAALWANPRLRPVWDRLYPWVARLRQPLSWLRLNRAYGWLVRRAAARAQARAGACATGRCDLP
jgi:predicted DCC family thiol-disulfide oxidoreductase YuxK